MTSDELRKALIEKLRDRCFTPISPGVKAMEVKSRSLIKQTALQLGVWDRISTQLQDAWTLSQKDQGQEVRVGVTAESPFGFEDFCEVAWLVLCATYKNGKLAQTYAVLVVSEQEDTHELGTQVVETICKTLLYASK